MCLWCPPHPVTRDHLSFRTCAVPPLCAARSLSVAPGEAGSLRSSWVFSRLLGWLVLSFSSCGGGGGPAALTPPLVVGPHTTLRPLICTWHAHKLHFRILVAIPMEP